MKFRASSLLNTHIYPYYKEEQSFYDSEHQKGISAMNNPNDTLATENLEQAAYLTGSEAGYTAGSSYDESNIPFEENIQETGAQTADYDNDEDTDDGMVRHDATPENMATDVESEEVIQNSPYDSGLHSNDGEFKPEFAAKEHSDDVSTQQDVAQASPPDGKRLEVPTWRQKLTNWFSASNAKLVAAKPKIDDAFNTFKTNALKLGKIFSGLLTAWFGLLLKASAILAFTSLIVMTPIAIVAAGIATVFLPVSIVLPLAAITFLIAPASVSFLGIFSAASAIALAAVGAAYVIKQRDIKTPESMVFHDEAVLLNRIGGVFFQTIVGLVSKVPNTLVELPEHSRNAAGYVYDSIPEAPATVKEAGSKLYAAMPDVRGGMTSAFNTVKENVKYYTSASDVADKSHTAMRSGRSSPKQNI